MFKFFKLSALVLCLAAGATIARAQTTTPAPTASPSGTASQTGVQTHTVHVGDGGFKFIPEIIQADPGDTVEFLFYPANHSVVRSEYKYACIPYEKTGWNKTGFFSGFRPVDTILQNPPSFSVLINDTNPIFFYCSAPDACIDDGMIGVINPNATESLQVQRQFAKNSTFQLNPGEPFPAEAASTMASLTMPPSSTATSTSSTSPSSSPSSTPPASSHSGLSTGAIVGIAIGAAAVALLAAALFFYIGRTQSYKHALNRQSATVTSSGPGSHYPPEMLEHRGSPFASPMSGMRSPHSHDGPPGYANAPKSVHEAPSPNPNTSREVFSPHPYTEGATGGGIEE
jgi:plastocyanin